MASTNAPLPLIASGSIAMNSCEERRLLSGKTGLIFGRPLFLPDKKPAGSDTWEIRKQSQP